MPTIKNYLINFGPQHPAAHGVLRLVIEMEGERIVNSDPHIGLLHRGTEKLIEFKSFLQALPYFDRLDYVSMMSQEHAYSLIIEQLLTEYHLQHHLSPLMIPQRARYIRILFLEITRILNHLLAITASNMDLGALSPFLWGFEEREKLMEFYERVSGARMHTCYIRPGGVFADLPAGLINDIYNFLTPFSQSLQDIEEVLSSNRIFKERVINIGVVPYRVAREHCFSGVMARGSGIAHDLRKTSCYENYNQYSFRIPIGKNGDCYDRFLLRIYEIKESVKIIEQVCNLIEQGPIILPFYKITNPTRSYIKKNMETLIHHFKYFSTPSSLPEGLLYTGTEAPKGEFGILLASYKDNETLYRCHLRAPGYHHLASLHRLAKDHYLADIVAIIGTLDIVFGEVDR